VIRSISGTSRHREKMAYVKTLEARLSAKSAQLAYVKSRVARAADRHRIEVSEQLANAERSADSAMATMTEQLKNLHDADDEAWEDLRYDINLAWEDLAQSIRKIVARFS